MTGIIALATAVKRRLSAPSQAAAAGFSTLVFNDDFNTLTTIAPTASPSSGYNWYWDAAGVTSSGQYSVNTTAVPGVYDGQPAAAGKSVGVLSIFTSNVTYNSDLKTTFQSQSGSNFSSGCWNHGYFEAYIQFNHTVIGSGGSSTGWPSFWLWAVEAYSPVLGKITAECDIMEYFPSGASGSTGTYICTLHNWANTNSVAAGTDDFNTNSHNTPGSQPSDGGWHTYGCLWQGNGTTGTVQFYFDNVLQTLNGVSSFTLTGSGSSPTAGLSAMENDHMSIILGSATGWPINVDWVRVWH